MRTTKRKPVTVGEMLREEFLEPMEITSSDLAKAMGVHRNTVSGILNGKPLTAPNAIKLSVALGTSAEFWLNIQHAVDLWETRNRFSKEASSATPLITSDCSFA